MDRRSRPAGKLTRPINLSPADSQLRPGRKLFAVHKNMHSFGFIIGTDAVAKQYFEKVSKDLQERYRSVDTERKARETPLKEPESLELLKQELKRKDVELRLAKKSYQALVRVNREETERSSSKVDAEVETEEIPLRRRPLRYRSPILGQSALSTSESPEPRKDPAITPPTFPLFRMERYTKKNPKRYTDNPILGYNTGLSPGLETQVHRRERSFADYGQMVLK